ncbi:MAG: DegV family protein, partial [Candidatus Eisenbacteria bacterium]
DMREQHREFVRSLVDGQGESGADAARDGLAGGAGGPSLVRPIRRSGHHVRVVTDSTADLPVDLAEELGVVVVPLSVCFGLDVYRDGVDLSREEFYARLGSGGELPTTTQPSPEAFLDVYESLSWETKSVLSIHISSHMSGTVQSARSAAGRVTGLEVAVVDSGFTCAPLGLMVIELARAAQGGASLAELVDLAHNLRLRARVLFTVGSLDHLARGGRIGRAQAILGKMARVRPILTIDDGKVAVAGRAVGDRGVMQWLADFTDRELGGGASSPLGIMHAGRPEIVDWVTDVFGSRLGFTEVVPFELGCIVGAHAGPGTWGVSYLRPAPPG